MGTALRKHLVSVLYSALILISFHTTTHAQGIIATRTSDGRLVYENAPEKTPEQQTSAAASSDTGMVYWSNTEHRWKPVPAMNSNSMRAAQSAAAEVRRLIRRAAKSDSHFAADGNALKLATEQVQNQPVTEAKLAPTTQPNQTVARVTQPEPKQSQKRVVGKAIAVHGAAKTQVASLQVPQSATWISDIVEKAALRHSVDPNLVRAIVQVESNFNPQAVSRKGAIGLMQLMPRTAKSLNVSNPYDPAQNVDAGVRHFKELLDSYGGNLELSLAAYNAGVSAVHKSGGVPHYSETRNYVKKITGIYGSNTTRLYANGHPPLEIKRDAQGHLSVSDID
jgi:soluble lytic murein transglycosylase-like protein